MTIHIYFGLPGEGKTYGLTHKAIQLMLDPKNTQKVFSNFPIIYVKPLTDGEFYKNLKLKIKLLFHRMRLRSIKNIYYDHHLLIPYEKYNRTTKYSTYAWQSEYTTTGIRDAIIILDEAHKVYSSRFFQGFTPDDLAFFAEHRHNNLEIFIISQHFEGVDIIIRRITNFFVECTKKKWFWSKLPRGFHLRTYTSISDYMRENLERKVKTVWKKENIPFQKSIAEAYNTHFFRKSGSEPCYYLWDDIESGKVCLPEPVLEKDYSTPEKKRGRRKGRKKASED